MALKSRQSISCDKQIRVVIPPCQRAFTSKFPEIILALVLIFHKQDTT